MMAWTKVKIAAAIVGLTIVAGGLGTGVVTQLMAQDSPSTNGPTDTTSILPDHPVTESRNDRRLSATLVDGTTIELLGIAPNPSAGQAWWQADGTPLENPPYESIPNRLPSGEGYRSIELPLRITGPDGAGRSRMQLGMRWHSADTTLGLTVRSAQGRNLPGEYVLLGPVPEAQDRITLRLEFAREPYQTRAVLPIAQAGDPPLPTRIITAVPGLGEVEMSNPRNAHGLAAVDIRIPTPPPHILVVMRAVGVPGQGHIPVDPPGGNSLVRGGTGGELRTIHFAATLENIAEFRIETRDYGRWIEFRDIAVKPDAATEPSVVISDPIPAAGDISSVRAAMRALLHAIDTADEQAIRNLSHAPTPEARRILDAHIAAGIAQKRLADLARTRFGPQAAAMVLTPQAPELDALNDDKIVVNDRQADVHLAEGGPAAPFVLTGEPPAAMAWRIDIAEYSRRCNMSVDDEVQQSQEIIDKSRRLEAEIESGRIQDEQAFIQAYLAG